MPDFTGFIACYENGKYLKEENNFQDKDINKTCATNWHKVDKTYLSELEIWWHSKFKGRISKKNYPTLFKWVFYHTGISDFNKGFSIYSRTIGCIDNSGEHLITVREISGTVIKS